jgi:hypothetical protein
MTYGVNTHNGVFVTYYFVQIQIFKNLIKINNINVLEASTVYPHGLECRPHYYLRLSNRTFSYLFNIKNQLTSF